MNQLERNEIRRKYQAYPDQELQQILIDQREQLIEEEFEIIESILTRKRYKLEYKAEEETLEEKFEILSDEGLIALLQNKEESITEEETAAIVSILEFRRYTLDDQQVVIETDRTLEIRHGEAHFL